MLMSYELCYTFTLLHVKNVCYFSQKIKTEKLGQLDSERLLLNDKTWDSQPPEETDSIRGQR